VGEAPVEKVAPAWSGLRPPKLDHHDFAVIGAGPAGLAAAVYAASDGLTTRVADRDVPRGRDVVHNISRRGSIGSIVSISAQRNRIEWPVCREVPARCRERAAEALIRAHGVGEDLVELKER
jgi:glycine/D-amino acid oxidase-like deaminating enzyme